MHKLRLFFLLVILSLPIQSLYAADYFISNSTGNDSFDGSIDHPWQNFWVHLSSPNALSPDDHVYFKAGDTWSGAAAYINCDSNGTSGHPIVFDRYGAGDDPVFNLSIATSGWTYTGANSIYYKTGLFGTTYTIGVDGTYALFNWKGSVTTLPAGTFQNNSGTIYIKLADSSNPASHTIYVPQAYQYDTYRGVVRGSDTRGSFISVNHLQSWYANGVAFSFSQPNSTFNDCTAIGAGRDGFQFIGYSPNSEAATGCRAYRCTATYCAANGTGFGQGFTTGASLTWWINCLAHHNGMAGFDFLDYGTDTDVHQSGMVYCESYSNGQNPNLSESFDTPVYVDGAHDILIYGCIIHGAGVGNQTNNVSGLGIGNENQAIRQASGIKFINSLVYDAKYYAAQYGVTGTITSPGIEFINCTLVKNTNDQGFIGTLYTPKTDPTGFRMRNCIILKTLGNTAPWPYLGDTDNGTNGAYLDVDYNLYYNAANSNVVNYAGTNKTMAQWQASPFSKEANGSNANPYLIDTTTSTFDAHLERIALGQAHDSPAINAGLATPWTPPSWIASAGVLADNGAVVGTTRSDGIPSSARDLGFHYYVPTPAGNLINCSIQLSNLYVNTVATHTITFTTANPIPADGKIYITYPISLGGGFTFNTGGSSLATFNSSGSGSLTFNSVGAVVILTRSGGSIIAAGQTVVLSITNILNPEQAGSTGAYQIKTTTSGIATIDIDTNVSADQIIQAPAIFQQILCSKVKLSGVKINA